LVGVLGLIVASVPLAAPSSAVVIQVSPGQSIQAALDAAQPGDTVMVAAGVYHESVVIRQDHITLQGAGATESGTVLEPPSTPTDSDCAQMFGESGICVFGRQSVGDLDRVDGGVIQGFLVRGFPFAGILRFGANGGLIAQNRVEDNAEYGVVVMRSREGRIDGNEATGSATAGIAWVRSHANVHAFITSNEASGNRIGIQIGSSSFGLIRRNIVEDNCAGILLLPDGPGGRPTRWTIRNNKVRDNTNACPASNGIPALSGLGMYLVETQQATVLANGVFRNVPSGDTVASGGIVVVDPARKNHVVYNRAFDNEDFDISWSGTIGSGTRNLAVGNECGTSSPAFICG
jgi:parallel beta-helix repeat protein